MIEVEETVQILIYVHFVTCKITLNVVYYRKKAKWIPSTSIWYIGATLYWLNEPDRSKKWSSFHSMVKSESAYLEVLLLFSFIIFTIKLKLIILKLNI